MGLDVSRSSTATATIAVAPAGVSPADPWDAPYFGGPVYFGYRPTLAAVTDVHAALVARASDNAARVVETMTAGALPADPWDAPYFGGPVYFGYAEPSVKGFGLAAIETAATEAGEDAAIVTKAEVDGSEQSGVAVSSEVDAVLLMAEAPNGDDGKRQGWLVRLFRRDLYIGRRR